MRLYQISALFIVAGLSYCNYSTVHSVEGNKWFAFSHVQHLHCVQDLNRAAINFNKHHLLRLHLKAWLLYITEEKLRMWEKERTAKNHHSRYGI